MPELWKIRAEIEIEPGDLDLESEYSKGFMNVIMWGDTEESACKKLSAYLNTFNWKLLLIDDAELIDDVSDYGPEIREMIARAKHNPAAIILGTFHSYRSNIKLN